MKRLSRLALLFSVLLAVLIILPGLLNTQFKPYPLLKNGDILDLFTPLILIPLYWLLFQLSPGQIPRQGQMLLFMVLAAAWAAGQGMHLSANSIGHLLADMVGSDVYKLTAFYDEDLSHYLWHSGLIGLSALIIYRQWHYPFTGRAAGRVPLTVGAFFYGFTYFAMIIEGGTTLIGVPFTIGVTIFGLIWARKRFSHQPMTAFFVTAYWLATLFIIIWAVWQGGLPEFSEVGIIE